MSKAEGKKIGISFTEDLVGDVSGLSPSPAAYEYIRPGGVITYSSRYSSSYPETNVFDGNTSTYWRTSSTMPQWVKIRLEPMWVNGFRWYAGSYAPNAFVLEGSNDDINWTVLVDAASENSAGWKEFSFVGAQYKYLRWTINSVHSSRMHLYEIEISAGLGNEKAFSVAGQEYQYVNGPDNNGPIIDKTYSIESVEIHPTIGKALLLTVKPYEEFDSVIGTVTVAYDATKGNLSGRGGRVESFSVGFLPAGLIPTPDVGITDNLSVAPPAIISELKRVTYINAYDDKDKITVAPGAITVSLLEAAIINP